MEEIDLNQFKTYITEFKEILKTAIEGDAQYSGEADELKNAIDRLLVELKDVNAIEELSEAQNEKIAPDLNFVLAAIEPFMNEDADMEDEEFEDDDFDDDVSDISSVCFDWTDAYLESEAFNALSEEDQECAEFIVFSFCHTMVQTSDTDPEDWTAEEVKEVLVKEFPRDLMEELPLFEKITPVLTSFFNYLNEEGVLEQGSELAKAVSSSEKEMLKEAQKPENWSTEKAFLMKALEEGVDLDDAEAMEAFIVKYNKE